MPKSSVFLCAIVLICYMPIVAAQTYTVRMTSPFRVGDSYNLTITAENSEVQKIKVGDQVVQDRNVSYTIELEADVEVLEVGEKGAEISKRYVVIRCIQDRDHVMFESGTIIEASKQGQKKQFKVNGVEVTDELKGKLDNVIDFYGRDVSQRIFGVAEPQAVGSTWSINKAEAVKDMSERKIGMMEDAIDGSAKLVEVLEMDGMECLHISANIQAREIQLPMPAGMKILVGDMRAEFDGIIPTDESIGPLYGAMSMELNIQASGKTAPDQPEMAMEMRFSRETVTRFHYK